MAYAWPRCKKILDRFDSRRDAEGRPRRFDRQSRGRAPQAAWDPEAGAFRCHYTSVALATADR